MYDLGAPADRETFAEWLRKGFGRTALFLDAYGDAEYRDALLYACTHCELVIDYDESRAPYLWELVQRTADRQFYRDGILAAFLAPHRAEDGDHLWHMFKLALMFAKQGDAEFRQAMYDVFARGDSEFQGAEELVELDGAEALVFVSRYSGRLTGEDRERTPMSLVGVLEDRDGKDVAKEALTRVDTDFAKWYQEEEDRCANQPPWRRRTEEDLERAAASLMTETAPAALSDLLRVFGKRRFPRPPDRLIELARSTDKKVAHRALLALEDVESPALRPLALELIRTSELRFNALRLLAWDFQPDDVALLKHWLAQPVDDSGYELLCISVRHLMERNLSAWAEPLLIEMYEKGRCSICRSGFVELLIKLERCPEWMRAECVHDCYSGTKERVA